MNDQQFGNIGEVQSLDLMPDIMPLRADPQTGKLLLEIALEEMTQELRALRKIMEETNMLLKQIQRGVVGNE